MQLSIFFWIQISTTWEICGSTRTSPLPSRVTWKTCGCSCGLCTNSCTPTSEGSSERWVQLRPLYQQLHAYVRRKLREVGAVAASIPTAARLRQEEAQRGGCSCGLCTNSCTPKSGGSSERCLQLRPLYQQLHVYVRRKLRELGAVAASVRTAARLSQEEAQGGACSCGFYQQLHDMAWTTIVSWTMHGSVNRNKW